MPISELVGHYARGNDDDETKIADVITFIEAPWGLNMNKVTGNTSLRPVQKMIIKSYYNIPLDDKDRTIIVRDHLNEEERYRFTELEYLSFLYNEGRTNIKEVTSQVRNELVLVCGRRGGKSKIGAVVSAYESYRLLKKKHPQKFYGLTDQAEIYLTTVATSDDQAKLCFNDIASYIDQSKFFTRYKNEPTLQYMKLRSKYDIEKMGPSGRASIIVQASPCSARGLRGMSNIVIILDEQAHFLDNSKNKSDAAVYDAVTPSTLTFGGDAKILNLSSPLNKQGKLWELYNSSFGSEKLLMFQIPTWELYPDVNSSELREKFRRNPDVYWCEIGAKFSDTVKSWMPRDAFLKCVDTNLKPKIRGVPRVPHFMGIDIGLKKDPTAITILHVENTKTPIYNASGEVIDEVPSVKYEMDHQETMLAGTGDHAGREFLDFDAIADRIEKLSKDFPIHKGLFDQYNGIPLMQTLQKKGLTQFEMVYFDRRFNSEIFNNFMLQVIDGKLVMYDVKEDGTPLGENEHGEFVSEVLELQSHMISKYITEVFAPEMEGKHDDRADSFARALWCATEHLTKNRSYQPDPGLQQLLQGASSYNLFQMRKAKHHMYVNERRAMRQNSPLQVFFNRKGRR